MKLAAFALTLIPGIAIASSWTSPGFPTFSTQETGRFTSHAALTKGTRALTLHIDQQCWQPSGAIKLNQMLSLKPCEGAPPQWRLFKDGDYTITVDTRSGTPTLLLSIKTEPERTAQLAYQCPVWDGSPLTLDVRQTFPEGTVVRDYYSGQTDTVQNGLFDVVSTALCAGIEDESTLNAVMGTWAVTSGIAHGLSDHEAHPYVYGRYVNDGQYIVHEASPTSSGNLEWFTAQWGDLSFDEINQAVASLPKAGSDLFFLPFLYGSNAGLEMTCGFYGMQALHTRAHLLQAIYEGVVFSHMTHLNRMRERFTDVCALRVTGGPAHSDVWMQMLADVSGLRIELPQVEETGCFGAALAARVGTGVYRDFREAQRDLQHPVRTLLPDMTAHALYQRKYRQYQDLIEALQGYHARIKEHAL